MLTVTLRVPGTAPVGVVFVGVVGILGTPGMRAAPGFTGF